MFYMSARQRRRESRPSPPAWFTVIVCLLWGILFTVLACIDHAQWKEADEGRLALNRFTAVDLAFVGATPPAGIKAIGRSPVTTVVPVRIVKQWCVLSGHYGNYWAHYRLAKPDGTTFECTYLDDCNTDLFNSAVHPGAVIEAQFYGGRAIALRARHLWAVKTDDHPLFRIEWYERNSKIFFPVFFGISGFVLLATVVSVLKERRRGRLG